MTPDKSPRNYSIWRIEARRAGYEGRAWILVEEWEERNHAEIRLHFWTKNFALGHFFDWRVVEDKPK